MNVRHNKTLMNTHRGSNPIKPNAYGYVRVSDIIQISRHSLSTQEASIKTYCTVHGLNLVKVFSDKGKSGLSTDNRDEFQDLLDILKSGDFVIVYEVSRFSRKQQDVHNLYQDIVYRKGAIFISLNPPIDSREQSAELMLGIIASLAQDESMRTGQRVKSNMQKLSSEGKLVCRPPFGFYHDKFTRRFEEDFQQQEIVKIIETLYKQGTSMNQITKHLNESGLGKCLNNNKKKPIVDPKFSVVTIGSILRGYGILKDDASPKFTYRERVANWNSVFHKSKIKRTKDDVSTEIIEDDTLDDFSDIPDELVSSVSNLDISNNQQISFSIQEPQDSNANKNTTSYDPFVNLQTSTSTSTNTFYDPFANLTSADQIKYSKNNPFI